MAPSRTTRQSIAGRMGLLTLGTLLSRVLGMARETMIAATFDVGATDAFFIAWRIPNALRALLAEGALSTAFVPVFSSVLARGEQAYTPSEESSRNALRDLSPEAREALAEQHRPALREAVSRVRAASLAVLIPVTLLGMLFARPALGLLAGDFGGDTARFELSASLLRVLFPYIFFMGSAAVGVGVLQSLGDVRALAFAPAMLNVAFLLAPFAFIPLCVRLGFAPIYGLALGALLGGALQLGAILPTLRREGMLPRPVLDLRHPSVRKVGSLLAPVIFGLAVYQIDVVLSNRFLSSLPRGAASFFSYAQRLADIPQGVFIVSIASSFLPELSRAMAAQDRDGASELVGRMLRISAFVAVPVSVLMATYGEAIVPVVYGYGRFLRMGDAGVMEVVHSLRWQAANVALLALVRQITAAYNAAQDVRTPVIVSAVDLCAFVALAYVLRGPMGHVGVAAAITGSTLVQLTLLLARVSRVVRVPWGAVLPMIAKALICSAFMGVLARAVVSFAPVTLPTLASRLLALAAGAALGTVYLVSAWLLRIDEVRTVTDKLSRRLLRRRSTV